MAKRSEEIDVLKGFLIILVVIGHARRGVVHDVIFLFHMPVFFMISGMLIDRDKLLSKGYIEKKVLRLMLSYATYLFLDMVLIRRDYSIYMLWGGRAIPGVYWYITCYLFALYVMSLDLKVFSERTAKSLILAGGV